MKLSAYVQGVVSEYAPTIKQAATEEAGAALLKLDSKLRDPKVVGGVIRSVAGGLLGGLLEVWNGCPHGTPKGQPCDKCPKKKPKKRKIPKPEGEL